MWYSARHFIHPRIFVRSFCGSPRLESTMRSGTSVVAIDTGSRPRADLSSRRRAARSTSTPRHRSASFQHAKMVHRVPASMPRPRNHARWSSSLSSWTSATNACHMLAVASRVVAPRPDPPFGAPPD